MQWQDRLTHQAWRWVGVDVLQTTVTPYTRACHGSQPRSIYVPVTPKQDGPYEDGPYDRRPMGSGRGEVNTLPVMPGLNMLKTAALVVHDLYIYWYD